MNRDAARIAELQREVDRLAMLADLTRAVTSTLDSREALRRLARLVVPRLGDWCVVDLFTAPDRIERVAVAHRDPDRIADGKFERLLPPLTDASTAPLAWVLRGAPPMLLDPVPTPDTGGDPLAEEQLGLFTELGAASAIVAGLRGRGGQILGAVTVVGADPATPLTRADVGLVEDVARRAAIALDNGELFTAQRDVAEALQRSMLPTLPIIDGLSFAARYCPAGRRAQVGGDWYDAFLLPNGNTAFVIGDVAGHDLEAAVRMGQLRNILRGVACDRQEPPDLVLRRLDQLTAHLNVCDTATVIYAVLDGPEGGPWTLRWSNAGHPPPLAIDRDGTIELLDDPPDPLLGVTPGADRTSHERRLEAGATVVFYTDGLIESRDRPITAGLTALTRAAAAHAGDDPDDLVDGLADALTDGSEDDVAILAVRLPLAGPGTHPRRHR